MAHLNKDLVHLICFYLNIDEYDAIKANYKLDMRIYCKNVYVEDGYLIPFLNKKGNLDMIKYLHSKGTDMRSYPFFEVIKHGHLEIVKFLYSVGLRSYHPEIDWAYQFGHTKIVEYFKSMGHTISPSMMNKFN